MLSLACTRPTPATVPAVPVTDPELVRHFRSSDLDSIARVIPPDQSSQVIADYARYAQVIVRRSSPGEVEVHDLWDDVFIVRSGSGTLVIGSTFDGAQITEPGERRGGSIGDPRTIPIRPGDVVTVPAGLAHQVIPSEGETIVYLVVKTPGAP